MKEPFDRILNGKKKYEFRTISGWIESRLFDKVGNARTYNYIEFTNGYGSTRPWMKVEYKGFQLFKKGESFKTAGHTIKFSERTYAIKIGKIIDIKNTD
jgi:hypothetical protein